MFSVHILLEGLNGFFIFRFVSVQVSFFKYFLVLFYDQQFSTRHPPADMVSSDDDVSSDDYDTDYDYDYDDLESDDGEPAENEAWAAALDAARALGFFRF